MKPFLTLARQNWMQWCWCSKGKCLYLPWHISSPPQGASWADVSLANEERIPLGHCCVANACECVRCKIVTVTPPHWWHSISTPIFPSVPFNQHSLSVTAWRAHKMLGMNALQHTRKNPSHHQFLSLQVKQEQTKNKWNISGTLKNT